MKSLAQTTVLQVLQKEIKFYKRSIGVYGENDSDKRKLYNARLDRRRYAAWCARPGKRANRFKKRYIGKQHQFA